MSRPQKNIKTGLFLGGISAIFSAATVLIPNSLWLGLALLTLSVIGFIDGVWKSRWSNRIKISIVLAIIYLSVYLAWFGTNKVLEEKYSLSGGVSQLDVLVKKLVKENKDLREAFVPINNTMQNISKKLGPGEYKFKAHDFGFILNQKELIAVDKQDCPFKFIPYVPILSLYLKNASPKSITNFIIELNILGSCTVKSTDSIWSVQRSPDKSYSRIIARPTSGEYSEVHPGVAQMFPDIELSCDANSTFSVVARLTLKDTPPIAYAMCK